MKNENSLARKHRFPEVPYQCAVSISEHKHVASSAHTHTHMA